MRETRTGLHQPDETVRGTEIPVAWIRHRHRRGCQINDGCSDDRGLIHIIDRIRGMRIVERA